MQKKRIESAEVKTVYLDLLDGYGYYCSRPDKAPFICLDNSLLNAEDDAFHQEVHRALLEYHRSVPEDSIYRLFTLVKYYEDLQPVEEEIFIIGRAVRKWNFTFYQFSQEPHIIGSLEKTG